LAAVVATAGVVAVGCGSDSSSSDKGGGTNSAKSKEPIQALAILDMTGPTKYLGEADKAGLDAAVTYLNKNGGIDGRQVELEVLSDNGDPTTSVTTLTKYVAQKGKPDYLFGGSYSSISAAIQPVASRNKIMSWAFGDGNFACEKDASAKCGPFFAVNSRPEVYVQQSANYLKEKGYKKIGIIADQRDTSTTESAIQKDLYPKAGLEPVFVTTPAKTVNVLPQMSKLKAEGVDVVFAEQIGPAVGYVLQARKKLGWDVPVVFDISGSSSSITTLAPKELWSDNVDMQIFSMIDPKRADHFPGVKKMLESNTEAQKEGGFGGQAANVGVFGWNNLMLYAAVVNATHSTDPVVNQKWLETNEVPLDDTMTGATKDTRALMTTHKFTADRHENEGWQPDDYAIVPVAPVGNDGHLAPAGS
jgi:branched-chain amino acid transport system substrate-binding protein